MSGGRLQALSGEGDLSIVRSAGGATKVIPALPTQLTEQQDVLKVLMASVTTARRRFESRYSEEV